MCAEFSRAPAKEQESWLACSWFIVYVQQQYSYYNYTWYKYVYMRSVCAIDGSYVCAHVAGEFFSL